VVVSWSSFISCPVFSIDVSSAYIIDLSCVRSGISFAHRIKSNGLRTDPYGTPYLTGRLLEKYSFFFFIISSHVLLVI
jgi:hypothetical protein